MPEIIKNAGANLKPRMRNLVSLLWKDRHDLQQQIVAMNEESSRSPRSGRQR